MPNFNAKYESKCLRCETVIHKGERASFTPGVKGIAHVEGQCQHAFMTLTLDGEFLRQRQETCLRLLAETVAVITDEHIEACGECPSTCKVCHGQGLESITAHWDMDDYSSTRYRKCGNTEDPYGDYRVEKNETCVSNQQAYQNWTWTLKNAMETNPRWLALEAERVRLADLLTPKSGVLVEGRKGRKQERVVGVVKWVGVDAWRGEPRLGLAVEGEERLVYVATKSAKAATVTVTCSLSDGEAKALVKKEALAAGRRAVLGKVA